MSLVSLFDVLAHVVGVPDLTTSQPHNLTTSQPHNLTTSQPHNLTTSQPHNLTTSQPHNLIAFTVQGVGGDVGSTCTLPVAW
jgi:hypothetical protein